MSSYQPLIPTGLVNLDVDYQNIQDNFQQLDTTFGVDHTLFSNNTAQNGYHKSIHSIPESGTPTNVPGFSQIYTRTLNDGVDTDEQLFYQTGTGNHDVVMTRNFLPQVGSNVSFPNNGYTFLPGGFIYQWGKVTVSSPGTSTITFATSGNIDFPNNIFNVIITKNTAVFSTADSSVNTLSTTSFNLNNTNSGVGALDFFWVAIGN